MLAILTTHPIQYQVPLWQMLARDGQVPFEVWYLSEHATKVSRDKEFGKEFAWDLDMLSGYRYRLLKTPPRATPNTFFRTRIIESLPKLFREHDVTALWVNGWQVAAYWQAIWAAQKAGEEVWLRGESNNLEVEGSRNAGEGAAGLSKAEGGNWRIKDLLKQRAKRFLLSELFKRVDNFLCIGSANKRLYQSYGVPESKLHMAMYAVDNERFARQANQIRNSKVEIRRQWGIPDDAFCVLFCGKFIPKKRPMDLIKAAQLLLTNPPKDGFAVANNYASGVHLLFVGSGELGGALRANCNVVFDAETRQSAIRDSQSEFPNASFTGFLNQTAVSKAYVAADCLVLPSDYTETWGLVVNEAMASGLPCVLSDRCGCAADLGMLFRNQVYRCGRDDELAECLSTLESDCRAPSVGFNDAFSLEKMLSTVVRLYMQISETDQ